MQPSYPTLIHLSKRSEHIYTYVQNVHCTFIHRSLKLETNQMFISRWIDQQIVNRKAKPRVGMLVSNKKKEITDICSKMDKSQKHWWKEEIQCERSQVQKYIERMTLLTWSSRAGITNLLWSEAGEWLFRAMGRGWEGGLTTKAHEGTFWGDGNILYLNCGGGFIGMCICRNSPVYLKQVHFRASYILIKLISKSQ